MLIVDATRLSGSARRITLSRVRQISRGPVTSQGPGPLTFTLHNLRTMHACTTVRVPSSTPFIIRLYPWSTRGGSAADQTMSTSTILVKHDIVVTRRRRWLWVEQPRTTCAGSM
ncbi:hypothetical protein J6590_032287 [Homalodisca vitripennis]|nr:hypothetical protein J6590_032287 [Homalodisca vitripennis]